MCGKLSHLLFHILCSSRVTRADIPAPFPHFRIRETVTGRERSKNGLSSLSLLCEAWLPVLEETISFSRNFPLSRSFLFYSGAHLFYLRAHIRAQSELQRIFFPFLPLDPLLPCINRRNSFSLECRLKSISIAIPSLRKLWAISLLPRKAGATRVCTVWQTVENAVFPSA